MQEMISKIEALLAPLLEGTDMFVTNLQIEPGNNIKLFFLFCKARSVPLRLFYPPVLR